MWLGSIYKLVSIHSLGIAVGFGHTVLHFSKTALCDTKISKSVKICLLLSLLLHQNSINHLELGEMFCNCLPATQDYIMSYIPATHAAA